MVIDAFKPVAFVMLTETLAMGKALAARAGQAVDNSLTPTLTLIPSPTLTLALTLTLTLTLTPNRRSTTRRSSWRWASR